MSVQVRVDLHGLAVDSENPLFRVWRIMAIGAVVLLVIGTFADLPIDQAISSPDNRLVVGLSALGLCPITLPLCVLAGAFSKCVSGTHTEGFRWALGFSLSQFCGIVLGFLFMRVMVSIEGLGSLMATRIPDWGIFLLGIPIGCGLSYFGYESVKKPNDRLGRRLFVVMCVLVLSFLFVELIKHFMLRPRYRTLTFGDDGIVFCPWYVRCAVANSLMADYGLSSNWFESFPSAHALQVASLLTSYYGLCLIWPKLERFWSHAIVATFGLVFLISACRMLLGAHFLSDVAVGVLVASLFGMGLLRLERTRFCIS